ncbi:drug resistance transporter, Bcr/CflA family protein [Arcticibacter svalbardensis MN12-7]|uniref:Drug resistance transporter, Bcr/CflA family protein n=1 Tax=Arcticibacter svalbardensis MN12-7 TaxID=1150600 RepID=R9H4L0_9SPHI|nr:MFS transporter [Arcticibacter svalbardensis]EOR96104.1 drug resistance transporter, Bcr/CflA family protein [Arcticibacter svalbardensis MN12-7]
MIKQKNQSISTLLAFSLIPLSGFATDVYIPSLPSMGADLHISSIQVQMTLTVFLISYGVSQLFIGSILDSFGRFRISLGALLVFIIASLVIALTHQIYLIYAMRIIHGITVAIIVVSKRAYFVDLYTGEKLKHYLSLFTIIWSAGPIIAPFLGGYLQTIFGWQSNFYFLAAFASVIAILELIYSGESLSNPAEFHLKKIAGIYLKMFKTVSFSLGLFMLCFAYSMVMVYNMTGPYIIEHELGLTPVVAGTCSLILGLSWMAGGFISKALITRPFYKKLSINSGLQIVFVLIMIFSLKYFTSIYSLVFFAFLIHAGAGFTYNIYFTYCLSKFPQNAGIAGGLSGGFVYIVLSFLTYAIVNVFPAKDERNLSFSYLILIILSAIGMYLVYLMNRKQKNNELEMSRM